MADFWKRAIEAAEKARQFDDEKKYEDALHWYVTSVEAFDLTIKHHKHRNSDQIRQKRDELLARANAIKEFIDRIGQENDGAANGAAAAKKKTDKDNDKDEKAKLRGNLEGAILKEKPNVSWDDVAGLEQAKEQLRQAVLLPTQYPQFFVGARKPWRGILLYGPPGTGKTHLARAVATQASATFFSVSASDLMSKWLGESERLVRELFELARENAPSIVFVDEVDSLCGSRSDGDNDSTRRVKTEFLVQMQGVGNLEQQVLVLGATNTPWTLDQGIRRRFERRIYIPLPEPNARVQLFRICLGKTPHEMAPMDFEQLGEKTEGYSGSDISVLVNGALMEPIRKVQEATHFQFVEGPHPKSGQYRFDLVMPCAISVQGAFEANLYSIPQPDCVLPPLVTMSDFLMALTTARPSVAPGDLQRYVAWTSEFGMQGE
eukprot:TRINITY_DN3335_c0_g1_i1.p1 TRINITY_DN3335_c0_g1~~TRINITY_DN3335_c0_g1_i1.p1  ORF type:complete len:433 (-),score=102.45 TRINITY_DN3335_c0_g1_i1:480-1778(-)